MTPVRATRERTRERPSGHRMMGTPLRSMVARPEEKIESCGAFEHCNSTVTRFLMDSKKPVQQKVVTKALPCPF